MSPPLLSVGDIAERVSTLTGETVTPSAISQAIYRRHVPPEFVTTLAGRKFIAEHHLDAVLSILAARGLTHADAEVS